MKVRISQCFWGAWVAQSVKCPTLAVSLGHDLMVCEFETHLGLYADSAETAWDSLSLSLSLSFSPSLSAPPLHPHFLSQNK